MLVCHEFSVLSAATRLLSYFILPQSQTARRLVRLRHRTLALAQGSPLFVMDSSLNGIRLEAGH
jgi:hypothetical protein